MTKEVRIGLFPPKKIVSGREERDEADMRMRACHERGGGGAAKGGRERRFRGVKGESQATETGERYISSGHP